MNTSGSIYYGADEIAAAEQRGETLAPLTDEMEAKLRTMNRADRRAWAREHGLFKKENRQRA